MQWLVLSIISAFMSAVWSLSVKAGLQHAKPVSFTAWYSAGGAILIALGLTVAGMPPGINNWGLLAGVFAGLASVGLSKSFAASPNPGYSMGVFRMQAVATAILSYFLFGAPLEGAKVVGMLIACAGVVKLARGGGHEGFAGEEPKVAHPHDHAHRKKHGKDKGTDAKRHAGMRWLWLAAGAGLLMSVKDLATKKALMTGGPNGLPSILFSGGIAQTAISLAAALLENHTLELVQLPGKAAHHPALFVGAASLAFALYQTTVVAASKAAPNVGIVKAIDTLGLVLTTFGSHFLYGSSISKGSLEGIGIILAGVLGMCLSGAESRWWQGLGKAYKKKLCKDKGICPSRGYDYKLIDALTGWTAT